MSGPENGEAGERAVSQECDATHLPSDSGQGPHLPEPHWKSEDREALKGSAHRAASLCDAAGRDQDPQATASTKLQ